MKEKALSFIKTNIIIVVISLTIGFLFSLFITHKLVIQGEEVGSLAEWLSAIGTISAVILSLYLAILKKPRINITVTPKYIRIEGEEHYHLKLSIIINAYNKWNNAVTLNFIGIRKESSNTFYKIQTKEEKISPGESVSLELSSYDIETTLKLGNYSGNLEVGFAEPDGTLHISKFKWKDPDKNEI